MALLTAACGDDGPEDSAPVPTTTQPKTTTTTTTTEPRATETSEGTAPEPSGSTEPSETEPAEPSDEEQLRQLTEDWYQAVREINGGGENPQTATTFLTGPYLRFFLTEAQRRRDEGSITQRDETGRSSNTIEDVTVDGDSAVIVQCVIDADLLIRQSDGEIIDDSVVAKRFSTVAERTTEGWRLASRTNVEEWEGQMSCA